MFATIGAVVKFVVAKAAIFPAPIAPNPMAVLSLIHVYVVIPTVLLS